MGDYGKPPPDVQGMSTLKVDNLTYRTTCESLRKVFDKYGEIGDIYIPRDYRTKESRGFAFVRFTNVVTPRTRWILWTEPLSMVDP